ncbi:hypothetical protein MLD38_015133 [Melastoma candidum]|uniref:Uncharacterized protein n=1 Tax=Melastoma candidum TaxID=119954 RepID=A0ACB9RI75_9MYRT|nr:hypothetical protein MLD38_015133 [Melastoma candidum]
MVAMFTSLCGPLLRWKMGSGSDPVEAPDMGTPAPPPPHSLTPSTMTTPSSSPPHHQQGMDDSNNVDEKNAENSENDQQGPGYLLPLPPAMKSRHCLNQSQSNVSQLPRCSSSAQKLKSSLSSTTILRSLSMKIGVNGKNTDNTEGVRNSSGQGGWSKLKKKHEKIKQEDSLWMKTIMLGEKCKVLEDEDSVFYDNKGNRIASFRP